jgi:putative hydrolase of the HAD superfamily
VVARGCGPRRIGRCATAFLFGLDNTLVDLDQGFSGWAEEFADERRLGREAVDRLIAVDRAGLLHREAFFAKMVDRFALPDPVDELWRGYRRRMPHLAYGWLVAIVTNGMADNQLGKIRNTGLADVVDAWRCPVRRAFASPTWDCSRSRPRRFAHDLDRPWHMAR